MTNPAFYAKAVIYWLHELDRLEQVRQSLEHWKFTDGLTAEQDSLIQELSYLIERKLGNWEETKAARSLAAQLLGDR